MMQVTDLPRRRVYQNGMVMDGWMGRIGTGDSRHWTIRTISQTREPLEGEVEVLLGEDCLGRDKLVSTWWTSR